MGTVFRFVKSRWVGLVILGLLLVMAAGLYWWPVPQRSDAYVALDYDSAKIKADQQFDVKVQVGSDKAANSVDVTVTYPAEDLEVVSTSTKQTRFDMVLFPPNKDEKGQVRFLQATAAPFSGPVEKGLVGTITFRAKSDGPFELTSSGKVVANNSTGTDLMAPKKDKKLWEVLFGR